MKDVLLMTAKEKEALDSILAWLNYWIYNSGVDADDAKAVEEDLKNLTVRLKEKIIISKLINIAFEKLYNYSYNKLTEIVKY